ncbi:class 3 adenylate cyclase [Rhizobium skierniewicense]|uniref:Class 3 adenylate cyclase n=1 Tax=Rhizobium skierniewicense TaxID=984260 RepID=A0A7W6CJ79_9HYPH|nr:adenylate/guanylate cyclase domain-containing protein [Rhizobium skierniewicense]MBB3948121.1 class 3 adenylate cyclase [Rhizobium skierniewicense]
MVHDGSTSLKTNSVLSKLVRPRWFAKGTDGWNKMVEKRPEFDVAETTAIALRKAERAGFRFAVLGRTVAVMALAISFLLSYYYPINLGIFGITTLIALGGLTSLAAVATRYEKPARFALFTFDASAVTVLLAFVPLSSGGDIPQNLVFLTSSVQHYYLIVAAAVLTLSPPLVLWTGAWAAGGLLFATWWIISGMAQVVTYANLPISPTRDVYLNTVLNPDFLGLASRVQETLMILLVTAIAALAVHRARLVVSEHAEARASERRVQKIFGRYVPAPVLRELLDEGHLVPQTRLATLLFVDIKGFTSLSAGLPPLRLVRFLNAFFSAVTDIADQHGGVVVTYIGDAVLISFNAPLPASDHAERALAASRDILKATQDQQFDGIYISIRIGVATGLVAAGTMGADDRQTYTVYGDAVNLAQRLQELNKQTKTDCLICEATARQAGHHRALLSLGAHPIRNLRSPVEVFTFSDASLK